MRDFRDCLEKVARRNSESAELEKLSNLLSDIGIPRSEKNIETIWSRFDMAQTVGVPGIEQNRKLYLKLVGPAFKPHKWAVAADEHYVDESVHFSAYFRLLEALEHVPSKSGREPGPLYDDSFTFITFNYDIALDCCLEKWRYQRAIPSNKPIAFEVLRYWLGRRGEKTQAFPPKLLKPHGSVNWGICGRESCGSPITWGAGADLPKFPEAWWAEKDKTCRYHGEDEESWQRMPMIVGPSWLRQPYGPELRRIWGRAHTDLRNACMFIVIGHSFPTTDIYFEHFLQLARTRNRREKVEFLVVNKEEKDAKDYAEKLECHGYTRTQRESIQDACLVEAFETAIPTIAKVVEDLLLENP